MCKHQSGVMGKSSSGPGSDSSARNCITPSTNNCALECQDRLLNSNHIENSCSTCYVQEPAIGTQYTLPSDEEREAEFCDAQHSRKERNERSLNENSHCFSNADTSEKPAMLQNKKYSYIPEHVKHWQNYELPLPQFVCTRFARRNTIPIDQNITLSCCLVKSASCDLNSLMKPVKNRLNFQGDLQPDSNHGAHYVYNCPNSSASIANMSIDGSRSHCTQLRRSSIEQSSCISKSIIVDEVLQKNCIPMAHTSLHSNINFHTQNNIESRKENSKRYLLEALLVNSTPMEFTTNTFSSQRQTIADLKEGRIMDSSNEVSYNLFPRSSFAIVKAASLSQTDASYPASSLQKQNSDMPSERQLTDIVIHPAIFSRSSITRQSLASSYSDNGSPICKICHFVGKEGDPLISPCRCSGTMQFIHCGCLMKWLEISSRRSRKPLICELCHYQYQWHKKFKVSNWRFPRCSRKDLTLHMIFFFSLLIMIACATITILCFQQDKGTKMDPDRTELTHSEIVTLICGVLFFLAFFLGMYAEIKATNTIYKLLVKFIYLNQQWYIDEYNKAESITVSAQQN